MTNVMKHLLMVFFLLVATASLRAQTTYNYDGGGTSALWSNPTNWADNTLPTFNTNAVLSFNYNFSTTNVLATGAAYTVRGLVFGADLTGASSFQIRTKAAVGGSSGNTLTLNGGSANAYIVVENITDTSLTTIQLGDNNGAIAFASNVDLTNNSAVATLLFANSVSGSGALNKYGIGTTAFNRSNSFAGGINIYEGTVQAYANASALSTGTVTLGAGNSSGNAVLAVGGAGGGSAVTYTNAITVGAGSGTRTVANINTNVTAAVGNAVLSGAMTLNKDVTFDITQYTANTHDRITVSGAVSGSGGIIKTNTGILILSASNSYNGGTTLGAGTLRAGNDAALGAGELTINGGVLASDSGTARALTNALTLGGSVQLGDGTGTGALTLGGINLGAVTRTLTVSNITTVAGAITNTGGLIKAGSGTLALTAANTYAGGTTISAGTLELGNGGSVVGNITNNSTLSINRTDDSVLGNGVSGTGSLLKSGAGTVTLSTSNSYSGGTTLGAGTLRVGNDSALGTGTLAVTASSTLTSDGETARTIANAVTLGSGAANVALVLGDPTGTGDLSLSGPMTLGGTTGQRIFTVNNTTTISGLIASGTSTGAMVKNGAGTLVLANTANVFTNNVSIQAGTMQASKLSDKGTASSIGTMEGATGLQIGQGGTTAVLNYTGTGDTTDLQVAIGGGTGQGGATIFNNGTGALVFSNATFNIAPGGDSVNTRPLTLGGTNTDANEIRGVISDITAGNKTTRLVKANTGTWILSGSNSYTGGTTVSGGTLLVNNTTGSATGGGTVSVASGANLGGSGFIAGATTMQAGSTLRPGNSPGVLTFNSDLTLQSGANLVWELWANTDVNSPLAFDQVIVGGNLLFSGSNGITLDFGTEAGGSSVNWTDAFWDSQKSWILYDVTGTTTGSENLSLLNDVYNDATGASLAVARAGATFNVSQSGSDIMINYIPEPSTGSLMVVAFLGFQALRRKRS